LNLDKSGGGLVAGGTRGEGVVGGKWFQEKGKSKKGVKKSNHRTSVKASSLQNAQASKKGGREKALGESKKIGNVKGGVFPPTQKKTKKMPNFQGGIRKKTKGQPGKVPKR